jgi:altronate hydrolase
MDEKINENAADFLTIQESDNVCVALQNSGAMAAGHKRALVAIKAGGDIIKYGAVIGRATTDIKAGDWVHTHNMETKLNEQTSLSYAGGRVVKQRINAAPTFLGFLRPNGTAGIRNEIWIIPTVGCVNDVARTLAAQSGAFAFEHPYGCSQTGDDHEATKRILANLVNHPNAGGVLVLGLGCENNGMAAFIDALGNYDRERVKFLVCQEVDDEIAEGQRLLTLLRDRAACDRRVALPIDKLVIGMKCGGSDGLSGITANPCVGRVCDVLTASGGTAILTEVPEMFGAEMALFSRAADQSVFDKAVRMVEKYKKYFLDHRQTVYENPSPGNKAGGLTTLEDKSLGCVQKGGFAVITDCLDYGGAVKKSGLNLLYGPGNDLVSATALAAAGAQLILFTTGRGTPFGGPVPTVKIASNTALFDKKRSWIDFDAGTIATGEPMASAANRLFELVLDIANGRETRNERNMYRGIAIFKNGVTL